MNKTEYLIQLKKELRHLPKEDLSKALDYFEEYFAEAGPDKEAQAIEDLGSPESAAEQIITNLALANAKEPVSSVRSGAHAIWVGILAIFAIPIALPLTAVLAVVALMIVMVIFMFIGCLYLAGGLLVLGGPVYLFASFTVLGESFWAFFSTIGVGLISMGLGILLLRVTIPFTKWFMNRVVRLLGKLKHKDKEAGRKKNTASMKNPVFQNAQNTKKDTKTAGAGLRKKTLLAGCGLAALGAIMYATAASAGITVTGIMIASDGIQVYAPQLFSGSGAASYVEKTLELEPFSSIEMDIPFASISIVPSDHYGVSYKVAERYNMECTADNGALKLRQQRKGSGILYSGSFAFTLFGDTGQTIQNVVTIYLPAGTELDSFQAKCESGSLAGAGISVKEMDIQLTFGKVKLQDIRTEACSLKMESADMTVTDAQLGSLTVKNTFGEITLSDTTVSGKTDIQTESIDVKLENAVFQEVQLKNTFGKLEGSNVTMSKLTSKMESGDVELESFTCPDIDLQDTFGSISLALTLPIEDYSYDTKTEFGEIIIGGKKLGTSYASIFEEAKEKKIVINGESCDIEITNESR